MTGAAVTLRGATLRFGHHVIWDNLKCATRRCCYGWG